MKTGATGNVVTISVGKHPLIWDLETEAGKVRLRACVLSKQ
jgi:hypothetical protein